MDFQLNCKISVAIPQATVFQGTSSWEAMYKGKEMVLYTKSMTASEVGVYEILPRFCLAS
jgi:hypothetical protein